MQISNIFCTDVIQSQTLQRKRLTKYIEKEMGFL